MTASPSRNEPARAAGPRTRDPERTRRAILDAAREEFCTHGLNGARIERITRKSRENTRMIYHYFGNKEGLYLAVLGAVYGEIRAQERQLDLASADPLEGMRRLIGFTFDFFATRSDFLALIGSENIQRARFLRQLPDIQAMTTPLTDSIRDLLARGHRQGVFRADVDAVQFYVSIVAQSQLHISNRFTLSVLFDEDLTDPGWLAARRAHSLDLLMSYLGAGATGARRGAP
ncbi:TetR/AcrR family transcriptional regulator [Palleronia sediminis]|uniref:TetR/AcrR family transcriptional regulator n=1 Tax=Palleronia sediminis TaxID=2547833 RepID=A0A4R6ABC5_9RHOB|nr:TetR/AcrR family transcriptional regulator [Palleronia sediminis]TDL81251.1 TetR/AcrR family transcriptional regulator [Palleronia sediminis]